MGVGKVTTAELGFGFGLLLMGFLLCAYLASLAARTQRPYSTPDLHHGKWGKPLVRIGRGGSTLVTWTREEQVQCVGTWHQAVSCTIGPGMAHLDECACGKTRSGVYGEWLS